MKLHHAHDHVQLDDVVQLFDHDRQKGMLERIFRDDDFQQKKQQYQLKKEVSEARDLQRAPPAKAESTRQQPILSSAIGKGEDVGRPEAGFHSIQRQSQGPKVPLRVQQGSRGEGIRWTYVAYAGVSCLHFLWPWSELSTIL